MSKMLNVEQGCESCWATICMSSLNQNELPGCIDVLPSLLNVGVSSWCWQKTILWKCFGSMLEDIIDVFSITCMTWFFCVLNVIFLSLSQLPTCSCQSRAMWSWQISEWQGSLQILRLRETHLLARLSGWLQRLSNSLHMTSRWVHGLDKSRYVATLGECCL